MSKELLASRFKLALTIKTSQEKVSALKEVVDMSLIYSCSDTNGKALYELAENYYLLGEIDECNTVLKGLLGGEHTSFSESSASGYILKGVIQFHKGKYKKALGCYNQAIQLSEELNCAPKKTEALIKIGALFQMNKKYSKALKIYFEIIEVLQNDLENEQNRYLYTNVCLNLAYIYEGIGSNKKSFHYAQESYKYVSKENGTNVLPKILFALAYYAPPSKKEQYFKAAMSYAESCNLESSIIEAYRGYGDFLFKKGDAVKAIGYYKKALKFNLSSVPVKTQLQISLSEALLKNNELHEAKLLLSELLLTEKLYFHQRKKVLLFASEVFGLLQDYKKAYEYLLQYKIEQQKKNNDDEITIKAKLEKKYKLKSKENEILLLNEKQSNLEKLNTNLEQFAGKVVHDIREPMRNIKLNAFLLKEFLSENENLKGDSKLMLNAIEGNASRIDSFIVDMLSYTKSTSTSGPYVSLDLNEVLNLVKLNLNILINENNAIFVLDTLPTIRANKYAMLCFFQNLFHNAIKFRKESETPRICLIYKDTARFHLFVLKDNGMGISIENQEKIFNFLFKTQHNNKSGTGMGLASCKKIIENLGGSIRVKSKLGIGSTFTFMIPK